MNHREEFIPLAEIFWGECPYGGEVGVPLAWGTLQLISVPPVPVEHSTWGALKSQFSGSR